MALPLIAYNNVHTPDKENTLGPPFPARPSSGLIAALRRGLLVVNVSSFPRFPTFPTFSLLKIVFRRRPRLFSESRVFYFTFPRFFFVRSAVAGVCSKRRYVRDTRSVKGMSGISDLRKKYLTDDRTT